MSALTLSEREFQEKIIARARARGWPAHHVRPAKNRRGEWSVPISENPGFPDLVLARPGQVLFRELKVPGGRLTDAQRLWLDVLGGEVWLPRGSDHRWAGAMSKGSRRDRRSVSWNAPVRRVNRPAL